jgi:multiple sugar transport system substrate-binding protein
MSLMRQWWLRLLPVVMAAGVVAGMASSALAEPATVRLRIQEVPFYRNLVGLFAEANPDLRVDVSVIPFNHDSLKTQLAAGVGPDAGVVHAQEYEFFARSGHLLALDSYMQRDRLGQAAFPFDISPWRLDGHFYGLPQWTGFGPAWLYNATRFADFGTGLPGDDVTWSEMLRLTRKLTVDTNGDGQTDLFGIGAGWLSTDVLTAMLWLNGADLYNGDQTRIALTEPPAIEAIDFLRRLIHEEGVGERNAPVSAWQTGKYATYFGYATMQQHEKAIGDAFAWGSAPLPYNKVKTMSGNNHQSWAGFAGAADREAAWEFVRFVSEDERALRAIAEQSTPATRKGLDIWRRLTPVEVQDRFHGFFVRLEQARMRYGDNKFTEIWPVVNRELNPVIIQGTRSSLAGATAAEQAAQAILNEYVSNRKR